MRLKLAAAAAAFGLAFAAAGGAAAQSGPIPNGGVTIEDLVRFLQNKGFKAEVKRATNGDRYISSASSGINFEIVPYDCNTGSRCASVQFSSSFDLNQGLSAARINEWNTTKRYVKAHIDDEGDPYARYDANTSPGGSWEAFADDFSVWTNILGEFTKFIGW